MPQIYPTSVVQSSAYPSKSVSISLQPGRGTLIDQLLVVLWLFAIPLEFPMASAFRYPVTLLVLLAVMARWRDVVPLLKRGALFFLLPALCLLSALWSDAPLLSVRFGLFMTIGLIICAYTAARLDHRQFVVAIFAGSAILMIGSLIFMRTTFVGGLDGGYAMIGIFPHKNVLGMRMLILLIAAIAIILDHGYGKFWRLAGLAIIAPALYLLFGSNSATALVLLFTAGLLTATLGGVWRPAAKIHGLRLVLAASAVIALAGASLIVTNVYRINPYTEILERLDKDSSLTGRTEIWRIGNQIIEDHPVTGVGAGSFWRPGVDKATRISSMFDTENNQFWFHNAYYEVTVHLGIVGLILFLITIGKAYWILIQHWLMQQRVIDGFIVTIAAILLVRTFTESELFSVFLMNPMIFWTGVFMALLPTQRRVRPTN